MNRKERAYSTIQIKAVDEDQGVIRGIASTPAPDRADDIVLPEGAKFTLPMPLLWQHNHSNPIGEVVEATVTEAGIEVACRVALGVTDEIDKYWRLMKAGLVRGLSIGFRSLKSAQIENSWGVEFQEWEWLELSAVTIPANAEASIATVKEYAASPQKLADVVEQVDGSAASGKEGRVVKLCDQARAGAKPFVIKKIHIG